MAESDSISSRHEHDFRINGHQTYGKPISRHPDKERWRRLRERKLFASALQHGNPRCAVCPREHNLELHHIHYDTWGRERDCDVELLCRECHEAITNKRREERRPYEKARYQETKRDPAASSRPPAPASKDPELPTGTDSVSPGRPVIDEPGDIQPGRTAPYRSMKPDLGGD